MTKILTKKLTKVINKKDISKGLNFAGLPGNLTEEPVHIMNMIIEDAKDNNKELWLVLQDMKKAFDSVSLTVLKLAIERIKLLKVVIKLILYLFTNRESKIIIYWDHTKAL